MTSGRHREPGHRPRSPWSQPYQQRYGPAYEPWDAAFQRRQEVRRRRILLAMVAGMVVALVATGLAVAYLISDDGTPQRDAAGIPKGCAGKTMLAVVAAPDITPLVDSVARTLGTTGGCPVVAVAAERSAGNAPPSDVWVPSSSLWLRARASGEARGFPAEGVSLARSPVVVATTRPVAESLGWPNRQPGWAELAGRTINQQIPRFSVADPLTTTTGLLSVLAINAAMARISPDPGIGQLRALAFRSRLADARADVDGLLRQLSAAADPAGAARDVGMFPLTEQALWSAQRDGGAPSVVAMYPVDAIVEADYPLALSNATKADPDRRDLATKLLQRLQSAETVGSLAGLGFRAPASAGAAAQAAPRAPGLRPGYPPALRLTGDAKQVAELAATWAAYKPIAVQVLVLVDISGSMNDQTKDKAGRVTTKAELMRRAGLQAGELLQGETSLALWAFHTAQPGTPYTVAVPFGKVGEAVNGVPRRDIFQRWARQISGIPGSGTPLYETVLRGMADMRGRYAPDALNMIVLLTDGRDEDSVYTMSREQFLSRLGALVDPTRPVPIFSIGYGQNADVASLQAMSGATGGQAIISSDPNDLAAGIARIFLAAHQRR